MESYEFILEEDGDIMTNEPLTGCLATVDLYAYYLMMLEYPESDVSEIIIGMRAALGVNSYIIYSNLRSDITANMSEL